MTDFLLDLQVDVMEPIYNLCSVPDLVNFACCSRTCYASVKYLIWRFIKIPWVYLQQRSLTQRQVECLQYTIRLTFSNKNNFSGDVNWKNVASNYEQILRRCNPYKLLSIRIDGVMVDKGVKLTLKWLDKLHSAQDMKENNYNNSTTPPPISASGRRSNSVTRLFGNFRILPRHAARSCSFRDEDLLEKNISYQYLNELYLSHCLWLTDNTLRHISTLTDLKRLTISHNHISSNGFLHIGKLYKLVELNIESTLISDHSLNHISQTLRSLQTLNCGRCNDVTDIGLSHISKFTKLTNLDISWCTKITDKGFSHLRKLTLLTRLKLQGCTLLTDDGIKHIQVCTGLEKLNIGCTNVTDLGLSYIGKLHRLEQFIINGCNKVTGYGLACLTDMKMMKELDLSGRTSVMDEGLSYLPVLTSLRFLKMQNCTQLTDVGLCHICRSKSLIELNISGCTNITDLGVSYIRHLKSLEYLVMNGCHKVTGSGLSHLGELTSLKELSIININMYA